MTFSFIQLSWW